MASSFGLYTAAKCADERRPWTVPAFAALLPILTIAFIYSNNMSLVIRPEAWASMYQANPTGMHLSVGARRCILVGSSLSSRRFQSPARRSRCWRSAGHATRLRNASSLGPVAWQSPWVWLWKRLSPSWPLAPASADHFRSIKRSTGWKLRVCLGCGHGAPIRGRSGGRCKRRPSRITGVAAALVAFLNVAATVMVRDGIRNFTVRAAGFEVWNRQVVTNWSVVGLFLEHCRLNHLKSLGSRPNGPG
jgi:hypothetical protein